MSSINPESEREPQKQADNLKDSTLPETELSRSQALKALAAELQHVGPHPTKECDEIQKGLKVRKGAMLNVYTGFIPGIAVQDGGTHGFTHMAYVRHIAETLKAAGQKPLNDSEEDMLLEHIVSGFVNPVEQQVLIRPDRGEEVLLQALDILEAGGVERSHIAFLGSDDYSLRILKKMGVLHLVEAYAPRNPEELVQSVLDTIVTTESGNAYFYVRSRGERLITPSGVESLKTAAEDREKLLARVLEINSLGKQQSVTAVGNDVDFLRVDEAGKRVTGAGELNELVKELHSYIDTNREWGSEQAKEARQKIADIAELQRSMLPPIFHQDNFLNPQWVHRVAAVVHNTEENLQLISMPARMGHAWSILPGAHIGYVDTQGKTRFGGSAVHEDELRTSLIKKGSGQWFSKGNPYLVLEDNSGTAIVKRSGEGDGLLTQKQWKYHPEASSETKAMLNWLLGRDPSLTYAYVAKLESTVPSFETRTAGDEFVIVYGDSSKNEDRLHITPLRQLAVGVAADEEAAKEMKCLQAKAFFAEALGATVVREEVAVFPAEKTGSALYAATPVTTDRLLQEVTSLNFSDSKQSGEYFSYLGRLIAHAAASGRNSFGSGGEIIPAADAIKNATPAFYGVRSIAAESSPAESLERTINCAAARVALDIFALSRSTGSFPRVEIQNVAASFEAELNLISRRAATKGEQLDKRLKKILKGNDEGLCAALCERREELADLDVSAHKEKIETQIAKHLVTLASVTREMQWSVQGTRFLDSLRTVYMDAVHALPNEMNNFQAALEQLAITEGLSANQRFQYVAASYVEQLCEKNGLNADEIREFVEDLKQKSGVLSDEFMVHIDNQYPDHTLSAPEAKSLYRALVETRSLI